MKFILLVYNDDSLLESLPQGQYDAMMRTCLSHADDLKHGGKLIESQMLEDAPTARTVRIRNGKVTTTDGPFAETKEILGGFNLIEADSMEDAVRMAAEFPWARTGCVEVRPIIDFDDVRKEVGAPSARRK